MNKVLLIIPAYNEAKNIEKVVDDIVRNFPQYDYVVVNDTVEQATEDILAIVSYVYKSGYHDMYISDSTGQAYADFTTVSISDNDVCNAIRRLFKNNTYLQISKMDQTISFLQWTGLRDIGCGILFSKNVEESIESEFITELVPLSEKDWFYYVSDYNAWRIGERATIDRKME